MCNFFRDFFADIVIFICKGQIKAYKKLINGYNNINLR